jgi:hypothetical protein
MGVSCQCHVPAALYPGERTPGTHCTGGWGGPRAGLDTESRGDILCLCWGSNQARPVCSPTLRFVRIDIILMWILRCLENVFYVDSCRSLFSLDDIHILYCNVLHQQSNGHLTDTARNNNDDNDYNNNNYNYNSCAWQQAQRQSTTKHKDNGSVQDEYKIQIKVKAVQIHAVEALGGRGGIAPTHSRPRH